VKLASGDPTWLDLSALTYHYWTQPLPNPISPLFHALPAAFHELSAVIMFVIELLGPFLCWGPPPLRRAACASFVGLMGLLAFTGNYGFFQLLSVVLCLSLLDDDAIAWLTRGRLRLAEAPVHWTRWIVALPVALAWTGLVAVRLALWVAPPEEPSERTVRAIRALSGWRTVNQYGLFAVMTTERPEIEFQGSDDGVIWKAYALRYKPGDVDRGPPIVAPHMPRLDWQLWFAALSACEDEPFVRNTAYRLLQGEPDVLGLFAVNPFPDEPPRYVRTVLYEYRFAGDPALDDEPDAEHGRWWTRRALGLYCPAMSLTGE
jgi:hypothetical protein